MNPYAIAALILLAGGVGLAYVASDHLGSGENSAEQPVLSQPTEEERPAAEVASQPMLKGSADRRMDDFGSGPSGVTVTVPLKDRHQQAFSGGNAAGGGPARTSDQDDEPSFRVIERDTGGAETDAGTAPSFDVVRVDPTGRAVIAGRAAPLTEVEIKAGDEVIDRVTATASGEWVSTPAESLSTGDQELSLTAKPEGEEAVESRQVVVISIPETDAESEPEQPVAIVLDKEEGGEGRILQAPDKLQSTGDERLALKLVDYDEDGAIRLTGEAPPGVPVRIYVDNEPAALVIGSSKGDWVTTLDQELPGGDYTLRLDQLDTKGQAVARLETPLTRVATPPAEGEAKVDYVVVQPGNSLWRIARRLSGDGFNYVYIFEANQAQIRDPDIIYPGQVFEVPAGVDISAIPPGSG